MESLLSDRLAVDAELDGRMLIGTRKRHVDAFRV
jgi:hypothetical protein